MTRRVLVDGPALAHRLGIPAATLRGWAHRGLITRHGQDRRHRTLYDAHEVIAVSRLIGYSQHPDAVAEVCPRGRRRSE